ncbi:MAG: signal peptidase I [Cyanobacterium sp. T60_A2020_053]|nr:signal peptidase I [Cyanobacterium sp. T60_A2020_053]
MTEKLTPQNPTDKTPPEGENVIKEVVQTIILALFLSFGIRTFVAEARYIPSSSMEPTLQINDKLIIEKMTYRFRTPKREEIIVFNATEALQKEGFNSAFIKRVIGIPGDEVMVKDRVVTVNGKVVEEDYIKEAPSYNFGPVVVPPDNYLVLGDNRNNSYDSHMWGYVPKDKIVGRALVRFWPPNRLGVIDSAE